MDTNESYSRLRFERPRQAIPQTLEILGGTIVVFNLLWILVPHGTLYWLLLPVFTALVWVSSYGWRSALSVLHDLLHRLEKL